ncbi:hypothetical protein KAU11_07070, partial [Candidatus Babeliales bacterium]|nr:hypothetical protein [Candidatus Babeliales bacterium]
MEHKDIPFSGGHAIHAFKVANQLELDALTPEALDVDKVILKTDDDTYHRITNFNPFEHKVFTPTAEQMVIVSTAPEKFEAQDLAIRNNAEAIANLATAQTKIINDDTMPLLIDFQMLSFTTLIASTDTNIITLNDTTDVITFHQNASYNFNSNMELASSTNSEIIITIELYNIADNIALTSRVATLNIGNGNTGNLNLVTLLTVGKNTIPNAPLDIGIRIKASVEGLTVNSFRSVIASSSSYDVTTQASGISFVPNGDIASTNVQDAIIEVRDDSDLKFQPKDINIVSDANYVHTDNNLTDAFKLLLETKNVSNVSLDAVNNLAIIDYTDGTTKSLDVNSIVTDIYVTGATLDATTNVLTLTNDDSTIADVVVDLSDFVNSAELIEALANRVTDIQLAEGLASKVSRSDVVGAIGNITSPLLDINFKNSLAIVKGVGSISFLRDNEVSSSINRYKDMTYSLKDEPRFEKKGLLVECRSSNYCFPYIGTSGDAQFLAENGGTFEFGKSHIDKSTNAVKFVTSTIEEVQQFNKNNIANLPLNSIVNYAVILEKSGIYDYVNIAHGNFAAWETRGSATFNLVTGVVENFTQGAGAGVISAHIEDLGNGRFLCELRGGIRTNEVRNINVYVGVRETAGGNFF